MEEKKGKINGQGKKKGGLNGNGTYNGKQNGKHKSRRRRKSHLTWLRIQEEWCELEFTNKIVLIIGLILFIELILANFIGGDHDWRAMSFRTSLGAIIGYIIGGMGAPIPKEEALIQEEEKEEPEPAGPLPPLEAFEDLRTGWRGEEEPRTEEEREEEIEYDGACSIETRGIESTRYLRSLAAGTICIVGIIVVFIMSLMDINQYPDGVLQLRDMISTTLGFLISSSSRVR